MARTSPPPKGESTRNPRTGSTSNPKAEPKAERLEARVSREFKTQLMLAASLEGKSLTDFAVEHLGKAAQKVLKEHSEWKLSRADSEAFVEALLHPQPGPPRLAQAVQRYRQRMSL